LGHIATVRPKGEAQFDPDFAIGRLIFQAPLLLGGQAAKAGISCESCHRAGTDNPHFHLQDMSGLPGTADVTNSFFSAARENNNFDPVAIPDLTKPGKISRDGKALEKFIRDLIVEEFSGQEPAEETIAALAFYIRGLQDAETLEPRPRRLEDQLQAISSAVSLSKPGLSKIDNKVRYLLLASARHQLGLIHERYAGRRLTKHRRKITYMSQELGRIQRQLDNPEFRISSALLRWDKLFFSAKRLLKRDEDKSLYNHKRLKAVLN